MRRVILILLPVLCFSCEKESPEIFDLPVCQSIVLDDNWYRDSALPSDPCNILGGEITGDCLKIRVSYGGGCKEHGFTLYYEHLPILSQYSGSLLLSHNANGDLCKALITEDLYFDLSSVRDTSMTMVRLMLRSNVADTDDYLLIDYYYQ